MPDAALRAFSSLALGLLSIVLVWLALNVFGYVALTALGCEPTGWRCW
jgi:hypothetical protein